MEAVSQLYFANEEPSLDLCNNSFRITDYEILMSFLFHTPPGNMLKTIKSKSESAESKFKRLFFRLLFNKKLESNFLRICREILWKSGNWNTSRLEKWLDMTPPDIVFFCGGDSAFAYDIAIHIRNKYNSKSILYITDDYILPRRKINVLWWIRRRITQKKIKTFLDGCNLFITISEEMRSKYKDIFGVDSFVSMNIPDNLKTDSGKVNDNEKITLVYAGNLFYGRYKTLNLLAKAIREYNSLNNPRKVVLKIYTVFEPSKKEIRFLNIRNASEYCGHLDRDELKRVLNDCDIPVHVESFQNASIESTRFSISTKISDYLSLSKPILAIGPSQISSMRYLDDCAFCITDPSNVFERFSKFVNDVGLRIELAKKANIKFEINHNKEKILSDIKTKILSALCEDE